MRFIHYYASSFTYKGIVSARVPGMVLAGTILRPKTRQLSSDGVIVGHKVIPITPPEPTR